MLNRRSFLRNTAASSLLMAAAPTLAFSEPDAAKRKFTMHLDGGSIGVEADQQGLIQLAHQYGFESVSAFPDYLAGLSDSAMQDLLSDMKAKNLVWATAGLPGDFRKDRQTFQQMLTQLPRSASALQKAGVTRTNTWIMPNHESLNYLQNFREHAIRLKEIATILQDHDIRLGLEYVGPKTLWTANTFPFIHTLAETQELIAAIGKPNVGLVLDSFHWYTAGDTAEALHQLSNRDVISCDINDGHANRSRDEQVDGQRELPLATGVIDVKPFLEALIAIGYDGPVRAEPFNEALNSLNNEAATQKTAEAMEKAFALIG